MKGESFSWYLTTKLHGVHRKTVILNPRNDMEIITLFLNALLNVADLWHRIRVNSSLFSKAQGWKGSWPLRNVTRVSLIILLR